jgi:hypothetical protein
MKEPIAFRIKGLTVATSGLTLEKLPEIQVNVNSPDLLEEAKALLQYVAGYLLGERKRINPGETLAYGYWLLKFEALGENLLDVWEYNAEATEFVPGASLALRYWRDQHRICAQHRAEFTPPRPDTLTVVSEGVLEGLPVKAVHYPAPEHMSGWWMVTDQFNGDVNSLRREHTYHITAARPDIAPFIALPAGFRFDLTRGAKVWFDEEAAHAVAE